MTALVRDIKRAYPQIQLDVDTTCPSLWDNNPYLTKLPRDTNTIRYLKLRYGQGLREQNYEPLHFLAYFHRDFQRRTGLRVPLTAPYPDLHLSEAERTQPLVDGRYWVVLSGGKSDFTTKVWETAKFQAVVNQLCEQGLGVVQAGSAETRHWHPPLDNALNLVGRTTLREMLQLIQHADGVICGNTFAMHAAAALRRPCVVLAGGREAWWWAAYVSENKGLAPVAADLRMPHRFLHTIGLLECCQTVGCWRNKVTPLNNDPSVCKYPIQKPGMAVPKCLDLVTPEHVFEACMTYYQDRSLPPIQLQQGSMTPGLLKPLPPPAPVATAPKAVIPVHLVKSGAQNTHRTTLKIPAAALPKLLANARLKGPGGAPAAAPGLPPGMNDPAVFDHADVGGKFTIFVRFTGGEEYFDLHYNCLRTLIASTPPDRRDIRVGSNGLAPKSAAMLDAAVAQGHVSKHYRHADNAGKYPLMREMFYDPSLPVTTKWVVWLDDDSICDRNPNWLLILAHAIVKHHRADNAHMFGKLFTYALSQDVKHQVSSRPWFGNRPWRLKTGQPSPTGNQAMFCTGGFWAISTEAMQKAQIPDLQSGLPDHGGDWQIGEQLYQAGFGLKQFNGDNQYVNTATLPNRVRTPAVDATANNAGKTALLADL